MCNICIYVSRCIYVSTLYKYYYRISLTVYKRFHSIICTLLTLRLKLTRGVMKVTCSTPGAKSWLSNAVQRIPPLWSNIQLKVIDFNKLPQQNRVLGLFPNCKLNIEQIRQILAAMNPQLSVGCWTILKLLFTNYSSTC